MLGYVLNKLKLKHFTLILLIVLLFYYVCIKKTDEQNSIIFWWTPELMLENERQLNCEYKTCLLSKNPLHFDNAKALLFYGSHLNVNSLPLPKNKSWTLYHEESPRNVPIFLNEAIYELFDITATFSRNSDLPLTFFHLNNLENITSLEFFIPVKEKNKFDDLAPIFYLQSNCDTPNNRDWFVSELMRFIKVDSYGNCLNNKRLPDELSKVEHFDLFNTNLLHFIAKYKFVIAFENAICDDYVTEKLWRPIIAGSIPIYFGSPTINDWLPKNAAILLKNFDSVEQLALYLHRVAQNDTLYNLHLGHKLSQKIGNDYLINNQKKMNKNSIMDFECFVCENLDNLRQQRKQPVYRCQGPEDNTWELYWKVGKCQGEKLLKSIRDNQTKIDDCR